MSMFLEFEDVEAHVLALPREARDKLALGPIAESDEPDPEVRVRRRVCKGGRLTERTVLTGCRVCEVLGEGGRNLPKDAHQRDRLHAHELWAWHDISIFDVAELGDRQLELVGDDSAEAAMNFWEEVEPVEGIVKNMLGALSYARCTTIYALAQAAQKRGYYIGDKG